MPATKANAAIATEMAVITSAIVMLVLVPNGSRYPLVGGTRERHFDGIQSEPHKLLENAQTPTSRVHAVLGRKTWLLIPFHCEDEDLNSHFEALHPTRRLYKIISTCIRKKPSFTNSGFI